MREWNRSSLFALLVSAGLAAGCLGDESSPELVASDEAELVAPPFAFHGICLALGPIDFSSERCELADLPDLVSFVEHSDPAVYHFLTATLDGNAEIQCTSYVDPSGATAFCADVVDRGPLGDPLEQMTSGNKNFFVAYAPNSPPHPEKPFWDAHLAGAMPPTDHRLPPVELSEAGTFSSTGAWAPLGAPPFDDARVIKFDPRDCTGCGIYKGPGYAFLSRIGQSEVSHGWWPALSTCALQKQSSGGDVLLGDDACSAELTYRATGY